MLAAATFAPAGIALAQPSIGEAVTLAWSRAEGASECPDAAAAERAVAERIGRYPFSPAADHVLRVELRLVDGQWTARIDELAGGVLAGTRQIPSRAADCGALFSATVLVLALVIDAGAVQSSGAEVTAARAPSAGVPGSTPSGAVLGPVAPPGAGPRPAPPAVLPPWSEPGIEAPARWPRAAVHPRVGGVFNLLPRPGVGVALAAGIEGRLVEGSAGMWWVPEVQTRDDRFAFGLTAAWLGACVTPLRRGGLAASICGAAMGGAIHAVVRDAYEPLDPAARAWGGLSLSARLRVALAGPLSAEVGADMVVPLSRYVFRVQGGPIAFTQPEVGAFTFAGLGLALP